MDIVEFTEKVAGVKLFEWQKQHLRTMDESMKKRKRLNEFEAAGFDIPLSHELLDFCKTYNLQPEALIAVIRELYRPLSSYPSINEYCKIHNVQLVGVIGRDGKWHFRFVPKEPPTYEHLIELVKEKENG